MKLLHTLFFVLLAIKDVPLLKADENNSTLFNAQVNNIRTSFSEVTHATFNVPETDDFNGETLKVLVKATNSRGIQAASAMSVKAIKQIPSMNVVSLDVTSSQMADIEKNKYVDYVEPDYAKYALGWVDEKQNIRSLETGEDIPYGVRQVLQDEEFWKNLPDPEGSVKICVTDTGYSLGHADLPSNDRIEDKVVGFDNLGEEWNVDGHGHGTHCSGTIAALGNREGVVGVLPRDYGDKFKFVIGKSLNSKGGGHTAALLNSIDDCIQAGANIVSMSLGGGGHSVTEENYYKEHYENTGVLFIAAAGNSGKSDYSYPASYPSVISVAASDSNEKIAGFSQFNDQVEITGPGVSVKSTIPTHNYVKWSGTSMATPHVAGVAGLLWMYFPNCENYQIRQALLMSAKNSGSGCSHKEGHGLVQAKAAYELLASGYCDNPGFIPSVGGCAQSERNLCASKVEIKITTESKPSETSWMIVENDQVIFTRSNYFDLNTNYEESYCLPGGDYTFIISDANDDSNGYGSYEILLDGIQIGSGTDFGSEDHVSFTIESTSAPTSIARTTSPTSAPVSNPKEEPIKRKAPPTSAPVSNPKEKPIECKSKKQSCENKEECCSSKCRKGKCK